MGRVRDGKGGRGREEGSLCLGFCSSRPGRMRPWAVRPVLLPEGSRSWRVKSLPCVSRQWGGRGVCVCGEERKQGMLKVRKTCGLGVGVQRWGGGEVDIWGRRN